MIGIATNLHTGSGFGHYDQAEGSARQSALRLFERAKTRGFFRGIWSALVRRSRRLQNLAEVHGAGSSRGSYDAGLQEVSLDLIRGSQNRSNDFDDAFYPNQEHTRERWVSVAMAHFLGSPLPPVKLLKVGDSYFVEDGHHRISVARMLGQREIEAEVLIVKTAGQHTATRAETTESNSFSDGVLAAV
jgi:hypothetical protein